MDENITFIFSGVGDKVWCIAYQHCVLFLSELHKKRVSSNDLLVLYLLFPLPGFSVVGRLLGET